MSIYKKVLFTTDLSSTNANIAQKAQAIAKQFGAQFNLLHVIPAHNTIKYFYEQVDDFENKLVIQGNENLNQFCQDQGLHPHETFVFTGEPAKVIKNAVENNQIDLLILGGYGHSGITHLIGSVTHRLLHYLPCELMVLSPEAN